MTNTEIMPFSATRMDPEIIDKKQRERHISYDIPYMGNVKYDINELFTKQKQTQDTENKILLPKC